MYIGELLDMKQLREDMANRKISVNYHPTLPLAILNYTNECMFENYWSEAVKICRGLIVETLGADRNHEIIPEATVVARPFRKFFGLDHAGQEDSSFVNLPQVTPVVTEKVDGWLGILWEYHDKTGTPHWGIASRGSFTSPGAQFGTEKLRKMIKYGAIHEFPKGYTPVFEIIFKAGRIVIRYPFEGLILLGCVNIETGEDLSYDVLRDVWAKIASYSAGVPWIRLVHAHNMTLNECLADKRLDREGYVLSFPRPGTYPIKVKVKLEEYKRLHKLITGVTAQQIWEEMANPTKQMLQEPVPAHYRDWVMAHQDRFNRTFASSLLNIMGVVEKTPRAIYAVNNNEDLKDHTVRSEVIAALQASDPINAGLAMMIMEGKVTEVFHAIWTPIRPHGRETDTFYRDGQGE